MDIRPDTAFQIYGGFVVVFLVEVTRRRIIPLVEFVIFNCGNIVSVFGKCVCMHVYNVCMNLCV